MVNQRLLEELAARVLEVDVNAPDDEVNSAYREKSSDWHPDVSDDEDAPEKFKAAKEARDILLGDVDFTDKTDVENAKDSITEIFDEDEVEELNRETSRDVGYRSQAEARSDPSGYTRSDFAAADPEESREMMKEMALGIETVIIYESVQGMFETGYDQGDFFEDVNEYIGEASSDSISFEDYYEATKDSLRSEVTQALFVNSCEKIQENLQMEYGENTSIREVARIMAYFMVQGGIRIGNLGRFIGRGQMDDDPRFTRSHPLGGHGSRRRNDSRFTRGRDKYRRR